MNHKQPPQRQEYAMPRRYRLALECALLLPNVGILGGAAAGALMERSNDQAHTSLAAAYERCRLLASHRRTDEDQLQVSVPLATLSPEQQADCGLQLDEDAKRLLAVGRAATVVSGTIARSGDGSVATIDIMQIAANSETERVHATDFDAAMPVRYGVGGLALGLVSSYAAVITVGGVLVPRDRDRT
jgi:hypothetical protein